MANPKHSQEEIEGRLRSIAYCVDFVKWLASISAVIIALSGAAVFGKVSGIVAIETFGADVFLFFSILAGGYALLNYTVLVDKPLDETVKGVDNFLIGGKSLLSQTALFISGLLIFMVSLGTLVFGPSQKLPSSEVTLSNKQFQQLLAAIKSATPWGPFPEGLRTEKPGKESVETKSPLNPLKQKEEEKKPKPK